MKKHIILFLIVTASLNSCQKNSIDTINDDFISSIVPPSDDPCPNCKNCNIIIDSFTQNGVSFIPEIFSLSLKKCTDTSPYKLLITYLCDDPIETGLEIGVPYNFNGSVYEYICSDCIEICITADNCDIQLDELIAHVTISCNRIIPGGGTLPDQSISVSNSYSLIILSTNLNTVCITKYANRSFCDPILY
jgi:hypothetical protein